MGQFRILTIIKGNSCLKCFASAEVILILTLKEFILKLSALCLDGSLSNNAFICHLELVLNIVFLFSNLTGI